MASQLAPTLNMSPEDYAAYMRTLYPDMPAGMMPDRAALPSRASMTGEASSMQPIRPNEAQVVAEASTKATGDPMSELPSLFSDLPTRGSITPSSRGRIASTAIPSSTPSASTTPAAQPSMQLASAQSPLGSPASIANSFASTPNYYLGANGGSVPAGTAGAMPVSYGVATGGAVPAGTVTPSGNVTTGAAPDAGALGGGGAAPAAASGVNGAGIASALGALGSAAASFIAAGATPQPTMPLVQPVLADFPIAALPAHAVVQG